MSIQNPSKDNWDTMKIEYFGTPYCTPLHYAALSTDKQPASSQSPVEEKRVAGFPIHLQDGESVLSWLYGWPMVSQWLIMDQRFSGWRFRGSFYFRTRPQCLLKSTHISDHWRTCENLISSRNGLFQSAPILKYTHEDLDDIKALLPSLTSIYVASRYEQAPEHVF